MSRLLLLIGVSLVAACTCVGDPLDRRYRCASSAECATGFSCQAEVCVAGDAAVACDCGQPACEGQLCDGGQCQEGACVCLAAGGAPEWFETRCRDGYDNDCDGRFDCEDADCAAACAVGDGGVSDAGPPDAGVSAADAGPPDAGPPDAGPPDAGLPDAGSPDAGLPDAGLPDAGADGGAPETSCADGADNDGDRLTDCADSDCEGRTCLGATIGTPTCCAGACVDVSTSRAHCGGCGLACSSLSFCSNIAASGRLTGVCGCTNTSCPGSQTCWFNSYCRCSGPQDCAAQQTCDPFSFACRPL
jgi:hypothetical protein